MTGRRSRWGVHHLFGPVDKTRAGPTCECHVGICHSAAPPSTFSMCLYGNGEGVSANNLRVPRRHPVRLAGPRGTRQEQVLAGTKAVEPIIQGTVLAGTKAVDSITRHGLSRHEGSEAQRANGSVLPGSECCRSRRRRRPRTRPSPLADSEPPRT